MVNVATESVVLSYDRSGVGVNKIRERGALDVKGDIFADNKPIQQHRLTNNDGSAINDFTNNFDVHDKSGYYHKAANSPNNPSKTWGLLHVIGGGAHLVQYFAERDGSRRLFIRAKTNGNWTPWVEYAKKEEVLLKTESDPTPWQNLPLQNGWSHHQQYNDVQFSKTFDDVVYFRGSAYKGKTTIETVIGTLPVGFRPTQTLYISTINNNYNVAVLGIYGNGNIVVKGNVDSNWLNFDNISFKI